VPRGTDGFASVDGVSKGGYILKDSDEAPEVILIGTGSEVQYCVTAQQQLLEQGIHARVVSMPCVEWFSEQTEEYRSSVIPPEVTARVSIEAGVPLGWRDIVGDAGRIIGLDHYGASAPGPFLLKEFGFTPETVVEAAVQSLAAASKPGEHTAPVHTVPSGPQGPEDLESDPGVTIH
jgi:transketolase